MKSKTISSLLVLLACFAFAYSMLASERQFLSDLLTTNTHLPDSWTAATVDTACSNWEGIQCNNDHVISMVISSFGIAGPIPKSIGGMLFMENFIADENAFTGGIPAEIGDVYTLLNLNLRANQLDGTIPDTIGKCNRLIVFNVENNQMTGTLPDSIGALPQLNQLVLRLNKFTGPIPDSVNNLNNLRSLIVGTNLFDALPNNFGANFNQLEVMSVRENKFSGELPATMFNGRKLVIVDLHDNQFSGTIPDNLATIPTVQFIYLSKNAFSGTLPEQWSTPALEEFMFFQNQLTGELPASLKSAGASLKILNGAKNQLTGSIPAAWTTFSHMNQFDVSENKLSGEIPEAFFDGLPAADLKIFMVNNNNEISGCIPTNFQNAIYLESCGVAYTQLECCNSLISSICDGELTCRFTAPPQVPPKAPTSEEPVGPIAPPQPVVIAPYDSKIPTINRNSEGNTLVAIGAGLAMILLPFLL